MAENNQLSDNTKNSSTGASSTDVSSETIGKHENEIVPHKISNHDKLVQTMVMVDGEWINVNDTNDQANMKDDMNKVNKKVVEAQKGIVEAKSAADSAAKAADSAVSASVVNSDAIAAQSAAISEAKSAISSATAAIQQTAATAASDAAKIRADVAQVQSEIDANKAANSASVEALKSDISAAKQDLADVHDSLTKAQAAAEESQKAIDKSIAQINSDIEQDRKDIASAQQANADTAKQLDTYSKQAQDQGKTIKSIQDKQDGFTATLADVQGNVTQVSDKVDGLFVGLKDAQDNVASVKAQADQLSATLTDHAKSIATLTASAKELSSTLEDTDGRLSKVEQTAQTNSSTLSDVQGDLSQVKQDATTLTATLKDAQGNISTLQQKADSVSAQLASAQGDIASLQTDVTGIKATLVSHEGDIHTLQADSKTLKDDMQDAQGDISTLKKTSTDVTSELKDHAGRISKVEQTATTLSSDVSDQQGYLNKIEQKATGTEQTVANQQGQINDIKTDAAGIHQTLTGQGNQIANINVTLNGLNTKYEGVSGDLGKLSDKITTNSTQIAQNKKEIDLKADQSTVNNLSGEVSQAQAQLKVQAGQISSKVASTDFKTLNDKVANMKVGGRNLLHGTSDQWRTLTGSGWLSSSTASDVYTSVADYHDGDQFTYSAIITNPSAVPVRLVLYCYGTNKQEKIKTVLGQPVKPGAGAKAVSVTITTDWRTWFLRSNIETVDGEAPQISIQAKEEKLEAGNTATAWSPNPDDLITSIGKNSTAIDQTNKQISLKADQAEVDQIKNTASHNSSRLNVMAGEISSKVTSTDVNNIVDSKGYATTSTVQSLITQKAGAINESITNLTSKFNSLQVGGTNVLKGTDPDSLSDTFSDHTWKVDSGGDGHGTILELDSEFSAKHGFKIFGNTGGNKDFTQQPMHWNGGEYVFTVYIRLPPEAEQASVTALIRAWNNTKGRASYQNAIAITSKEWHKFSMKIDSSSFYEDDCGLSFGLTGVGSLDFAEPMLVTGSVASDWTPAPSDNATVTQVQQITASIDGLQSTVANKADESQITQLSNVIQSKVNSSDYNSKVSQLSNDINARVTKGDLLSQINVEAGRTLIQSNKIYFDADSFVMSPNSKAFIPSAFITNLSADKITTGTLDASKLHVKNFSADNISGGTLSGVVVKSGIKDEYFQTTKSNIYWVHNKKTSLIGTDTYINPGDGLVIADEHTIMLTTWWGAMINDDGSITNNAGAMGYPKIVIDQDGLWDPGVPGGADWEHGPGSQEVAQWVSDKEYTTLTQGKGFYVRLDDKSKDSAFIIQKDNCLGFYAGNDGNGNQINVRFSGNGSGFNIYGDLHVTGSKNSIVQTNQGYLAINAYETAEYYFGDIGESNTGASGKMIVGIDKIFNETVNTDIQYQVFLTSYGNARVWVSKRYNNRFVVESDTPNAEFGWELKAKRKGYEGNRLRVVHGDFDNPELLKGSTN